EKMAASSDWLSDPDWSGFRGNLRDAVVRQKTYQLDWDKKPPREVWRIPVGPGWGSFAAAGDFLFTQEQRGEEECVVCYSLLTGSEIWVYAIEARFYDPIGGPGPRSTPTIHNGALFAMGADGDLASIDAASGRLNWRVDVAELSNAQIPMWGYSVSPLVVDQTVVVYAASSGEHGLIGFNANDGTLRWNVPSSPKSYSSPHLCRLHDQDWIVMMTDQGLDFIDPKTGDLKGNYEWMQYGYRALQPYVIDHDAILITTGMGTGSRRVKFDAELNGEEIWTSMRLKPDFNDLVVKDGFIFGFDGGVFTCLDIETGKPRWKGGRYGKGQALLFDKNGVVLVVTEKGRLVLLEATPEAHRELHSLQCLSSKTWNHPIVAGDRLVVRNDREAVCYELRVANDTSAKAGGNLQSTNMDKTIGD
ncbi:MAG: PQQ-binding-like beta-propeller repeat protein, partial [Planctomycetota bacterium]